MPGPLLQDVDYRVRVGQMQSEPSKGTVSGLEVIWATQIGTTITSPQGLHLS